MREHFPPLPFDAPVGPCKVKDPPGQGELRGVPLQDGHRPVRVAEGRGVQGQHRVREIPGVDVGACQQHPRRVRVRPHRNEALADSNGVVCPLALLELQLFPRAVVQEQHCLRRQQGGEGRAVPAVVLGQDGAQQAHPSLRLPHLLAQRRNVDHDQRVLDDQFSEEFHGIALLAPPHHEQENLNRQPPPRREFLREQLVGRTPQPGAVPEQGQRIVQELLHLFPRRDGVKGPEREALHLGRDQSHHRLLSKQAHPPKRGAHSALPPNRVVGGVRLSGGQVDHVHFRVPRDLELDPQVHVPKRVPHAKCPAGDDPGHSPIP